MLPRTAATALDGVDLFLVDEVLGVEDGVTKAISVVTEAVNDAQVFSATFLGLERIMGAPAKARHGYGSCWVHAAACVKSSGCGMLWNCLPMFRRLVAVVLTLGVAAYRARVRPDVLGKVFDAAAVPQAADDVPALVSLVLGVFYVVLVQDVAHVIMADPEVSGHLIGRHGLIHALELRDAVWWPFH